MAKEKRPAFGSLTITSVKCDAASEGCGLGTRRQDQVLLGGQTPALPLMYDTAFGEQRHFKNLIWSGSQRPSRPTSFFVRKLLREDTAPVRRKAVRVSEIFPCQQHRLPLGGIRRPGRALLQGSLGHPTCSS